jgi:hypothetical protein
MRWCRSSSVQHTPPIRATHTIPLQAHVPRSRAQQQTEAQHNLRCDHPITSCTTEPPVQPNNQNRQEHERLHDPHTAQQQRQHASRNYTTQRHMIRAGCSRDNASRMAAAKQAQSTSGSMPASCMPGTWYRQHTDNTSTRPAQWGMVCMQESQHPTEWTTRHKHARPDQDKLGAAPVIRS